MFKKDKSVAMSVPAVKIIHGVTVKKLPIGKYIQLMQAAEDFLPSLLDKLFPGLGAQSLSAYVTSAGKNEVLALVSRALAVVPRELCDLLGMLLDIHGPRLTDPYAEDGLTPMELVDILTALWEVNDLTNFFKAVRRLFSPDAARTTGSNAG